MLSHTLKSFLDNETSCNIINENTQMYTNFNPIYHAVRLVHEPGTLMYLEINQNFNVAINLGTIVFSLCLSLPFKMKI